MSLTEPGPVVTAAHPAEVAPAALPVSAAVPRHATAPQQWAPPAPRPSGTTVQRSLAVAFALAWLACPLVEPMPSDDVHYPMWQLPIELASFASAVLAVVLLWRGSRLAAPFGLVAGCLMAVMTMVCPLAGHTPVGWWTWVQTGLSLFVMTASTALHRRTPGTARP
ncbi:hypothetical protein [Blastococcus sp. LR1]|uniref:hypothetical protein n=1 Tax=Blastococcus sp. LR1 TaxID=2877000 RepID=UPI001CCEA36D|nr:hypothetical protein [Blastococcus sp. LR1]MCA0143532.1 hypothetical protein [Blastococcus sp. LR1]